MLQASALVVTLACSAGPTSPPVALAAARSRAAAIREASDFICGPRCVQRVLEHFGHNDELIDLVREIQGAAIDRPATLAVMKDALERRGLSALGVQVRPDDLRRLEWQDPVIAHFRDGGSATGHFRVLFPVRGSRNSACVWDGLAGESIRPTSKLIAEASGVLLLTSALPIAERPRCLDRTRHFGALGATAVVVPVIVFLMARAVRRRAWTKLMN